MIDDTSFHFNRAESTYIQNAWSKPFKVSKTSTLAQIVTVLDAKFVDTHPLEIKSPRHWGKFRNRFFFLIYFHLCLKIIKYWCAYPCFYWKGVASYFLLIRWLLLLNLVITGFVVVFMIIPWELGKESCPNFILDTTEFIKPILEGCSRNSSDCDEDCVSNSDRCWNSYKDSVLTTKSNHASYPLKIIQVWSIL